MAIEPDAKQRFIEAMRRLDGLIHAAMNPQFQAEGYAHMRQAVEAFADGVCLYTRWHRQGNEGAFTKHAACRAALLKEMDL